MRGTRVVVAAMLLAVYCSADTRVAEVVASINEGRYDDAIVALQRDGARRELLLAVAFIGKGDLAAARREAESFLRSRPDDLAGNYLLALVLEEQGAYAAAAERWELVARRATDKSVRDLARKHAEMMRLLR